MFSAAASRRARETKAVQTMYLSHWGLRESPFHSALDPKSYYASPTHEEALARLHFLVADRRRLGLLLGGRGSGKSLLFQVFLPHLRKEGRQTAAVNLLGLDVREFLWTLAAELAINPRLNDDPFILWRRIADRLTENRRQELSTVLFLDDADEARREVLSHVVRLLQHDPSPENPLTVILASDPRRVGKLGRRLLDLAELRIEVEPWDAAETSEYLRSRTTQAGGQSPIFQPSAAARLHKLAKGAPRRLSQLSGIDVAGRGGPTLGEHRRKHDRLRLRGTERPPP